MAARGRWPWVALGLIGAFCVLAARGRDVIIVPAVSDAEAKEKFPQGWKALKPYLRLTPQPGR